MLYRKFLKPFLDILFAITLTTFLSPIIIATIIIMTIVNNGKPFFVQTRAGHHGKPFKIIKFKTMNDKRNNDGLMLPDSERLTNAGRFLRKFSIDELPQLFNVISGNLSLVGPRPLLMQYLPHYTKEQSKRHNVKPGITGWAQVHGRQAISFEKRFELDVWYVNNISFLLDIKILIKTFKNVLRSKGVMENERFWRT